MSSDSQPEGLNSPPEEWGVVKVSKVSKKMKAGGTPRRSNKEYWHNGTVPFVLIEDMTSCGLYLDKTKEFVTTKGIENSSAWIVPNNSLLLSMYATIGETAINKIPLATNQAILVIVPKEDIFDVKFGAYLLKFNSNRLIAKNVQSTQKNVNKGIVANFEIPLPPLPEQKRIAAVLSTVQEAKKRTETVIQATRELKKSLMKHLFTYGPISVEEAENVPLRETEIGMVPEEWGVVKLGDYIIKTKQKDMRKTSDEFNYIDVSGIDRDDLRIISAIKYKGKNAPSRARKIVNETDVIIATVRPTLKRIALISKEFMRMRLDPEKYRVLYGD